MKKSEFRGWATWRVLPIALVIAMAAGLNGCGGGGGGDTGGTAGTPATTPSPGSPTTPVTSDGTTMSSGVITAFGSVFVNGRRFRTDKARVIDDDTGAVTSGMTGLEVGMVVVV